MCLLYETIAVVHHRANAFSSHLERHTTEMRNIDSDNEKALIPVGPSLVLLVFCFLCFCLLPLHFQSQTESAGDILKTDACVLWHISVFTLYCVCARTRLQCEWIGALCSQVPWQVYSSTLSCTATDMSTGLWPFVLDSGLFLLPRVCSISAEIMCRVSVFFASSVWFSFLVPLWVFRWW